MLELLDLVPLCLAFATPQMPMVDAPTAPSASADAERRRQEAAQAAQIEASASGRASTDVAGFGMRMDEQRRRAAGYELGL
jgi:hypothetical protein